jgi:hypothetical protein
MAQAARQLGYEEDHEVILLATEEYKKASEVRDNYLAIYNDLIERWNQKEEEYPIATYIWNYFKNLGYSNQVCAGILGNIMTESGGNTLAIQYDIKTSMYYGMCQWSKIYYSSVWDTSLKEQCDYLRDTIEYEIDNFGSLYKRDFGYQDFVALTNVKDAALAFSKCYERNPASSYKTRQQNAIAAYNYFIG